MSGHESRNEDYISKNRLEALVDSVFAFAMTLLVISLAIPPIPQSQAATELPVYLSGMAHEFTSFIIAFLLLAVFWTVHHRNFHHLRTINSRVLWLNIFILICIVLVPFSTSVSGDYPDVPVAVILFHTNLLAIGLLFAGHWYYITHTPRLVESAIDEKIVRCGSEKALITPVIAATAIALSFFIPSQSMLTYLLIPPGIWLIQRFQCR